MTPENHTETPPKAPAETITAPAAATPAAPAAPAKKPRKPRAAKPKAEAEAKNDPALFRSLAAEIGDYLDQDQAALIARLQADQGLTWGDTGGNGYMARMAGISAHSTESERMALINWCNAARRALLSMGA